MPRDLFFNACRSVIYQILMPEADHLGHLLIDTCTHFWNNYITSAKDSFVNACYYVLK